MLTLTQVQNSALDSMVNVAQTGGQLIVSSTAGSGKTQLIESMSYQYTGNVAAMAYNKNAGVEMESRCKPNAFAEIGTFHAIGKRIIPGKAFYPNYNPHFWVAANITGYNSKAKGKENTIAWFVASNALELSTKAKEENSEDYSAILEKYVTQIHTTLYKEDHSNQIIQIAAHIVDTTIERYKKDGKIDFVDMLWIPVKLGVSRKFDVVIVDESQDTTPIKLALVNDVIRPESLIMIGDNMQAINLWTGAIPNLLENLEYPTVRLADTHRNGINGCTHVRDMFNVDHFPAENVDKNDVVKEVESVQDIPENMPNGLILSRTNADTVQAWHTLIRTGHSATIKGDDRVAAKVAKIVSSYDYYASREDTDTDSLKTAQNILDLCNGNVSKANQMCKRMFNGNGDFTISTVHKMKGATYDHVALLPNLDGIGDSLEERNIRFVANTRQKHTLLYMRNKSE